MDFDFTKRVLAALETHRVRYAVFGAAQDERERATALRPRERE